MKAAEQPTGLCLTCQKTDSCTHRAGFITPVFYCEEFDDSVTCRTATKQTTPADGDTNKLTIGQGLCTTCSSSKACALSGTPGGIWHCEEYR
jgi:hypothetical protein